MNIFRRQRFITVGLMVLLGGAVGALTALSATPWSNPTSAPPDGNPDLVIIGPASPQTDTSTNPTIWLEDSGGGDLIRLDNTNLADTEFVVEDTGNTIIGRGSALQTAVLPGPDPLEFSVAGDINADRLCIDGDCRDDWAGVLNGGGGAPGTPNYVIKWNAGGDGLLDTSAPIVDEGGLVGIGPAFVGGVPGPYQLDVDGQTNADELCVSGACITSWSDSGVGTDNQNLYETINVASGTDPVASSPTDVLNLNAAGGILLTGSDGAAGADALTFDVDPNVIQARIDPVGCPAQSAIQIIAADGSVTCETSDDGDWVIAGSNMYSGVSGNVGIGTSSPAGKLHVAYSAGARGVDITGPAGNTHFNYSNDWNYISGNGVIFRNTGNGEFARFVASSGRLGLGTTSPATRLHVNGSVRGNQSGALRINSGNGYVDIGPKNTGWSHFHTDRPRYYFNREVRVDTGLIGSYNDHLQLRTSGTTRMILRNDNGRVGIGTNSPSTTLQVAGNTAVTGWLGAGCESACDTNGRYALLYPGGYAQIKGSAHQLRLHDTDSNQYEWSITTYNQDQIAFWRTSGSNTGRNLRVSSGDGAARGVYAYGYFYDSDRRLKENIRPHEGALDRVLALNPVTYEWRNDAKNRINLGFIAQDVETVFPELVSEDSVTGLKSIDYGALTGPIVGAIREQQEQMENLEAYLTRLEQELEDLQ